MRGLPDTSTHDWQWESNRDLLIFNPTPNFTGQHAPTSSHLYFPMLIEFSRQCTLRAFPIFSQTKGEVKSAVDFHHRFSEVQ